MNQLLLGSLALALAQLFLGTNIVLGKYLTGFMSMYTFIFIRFFLCVLLFGGLYLRGYYSLAASEHPQRKLSKTDWFYSIAGGLCAGLLFNVIFYYGLQYTTATSAGIVACSLPAVMTIMAMLFLGERLSRAKLAAIALTIIGILIINIDNVVLKVPNSGSFYGDAIVFLAMIPEAAYSIFGKKTVRRVSELGSGFISAAVTVVGVFPLLFCEIQGPQALQGVWSWPWLSYPLLLLSGILTLFFYTLWGYGLKRIPVSTAAIFCAVVTVATSLLGHLFLGENFDFLDGLGLLVVCIGLILGTTQQRNIARHS
jgi:drug/metabolite transporter (DMT)-like permease